MNKPTKFFLSTKTATRIWTSTARARDAAAEKSISPYLLFWKFWDEQWNNVVNYFHERIHPDDFSKWIAPLSFLDAIYNETGKTEIVLACPDREFARDVDRIYGGTLLAAFGGLTANEPIEITYWVFDN